MRKTALFLLGLIPFFAFAQPKDDKVSMVDMFMGQKASSQCSIGPQLPHGSINPGPDTHQLDGKHENDGYAEGMPICGFSQLHVSGTGWGRYGTILLSPQIGFDADENGHDSDKSEEVATPYYYKVRLDRYDILCEVTPTAHAAKYRFTYPSLQDANLLLDICHNIPEHIASNIGGKYLGGEITFDAADQMITGYGEYKGGFGSGAPYKIYFAICSDNLDLQKMTVESVPYSNGKVQDRLYARIPVNNVSADVQIAVSLRSVRNAKQYLREEIAGKSFDDIAASARGIWNDTFSKIRIDGASATEEKLFYTSMYFSFVMPRDRSDDNPRWLGENIDDHYCIWDTWRTNYPMMILIDEPFVAKTITSFINRYENDGVCNPTFTSSLDEESRQGGDDCENVVADAIVKGVGGFDYDKAYAYIKDNSQKRRSPEYQKYGWQPETGIKMSCSNALEYAYNDYCVYEVAKSMGDKAYAKQMLDRSHSWKMLFNASQKDTDSDFYGFIAPRVRDGISVVKTVSGDYNFGADGFVEEFKTRKIFGSWVEFFYEGNTWTYTLFTPHDFPALIKLCGGKERMIERLTYGFENRLIDLSNEPGFLSPFIFSECGRMDLTAKYVSQLRNRNFSLERGFGGNEDSGAMGSWYIFTGIGIFPNAGQDYYYLLPPSYKEITMDLSNGKVLHISKQGNSGDLKVYFNGKRIKGNTIKHSILVQGGELKFVYTD